MFVNADCGRSDELVVMVVGMVAVLVGMVVVLAGMDVTH